MSTQWKISKREQWINRAGSTEIKVLYKVNEARAQGWKDGSVGKVFVVKVWGAEFRSLALT